MLFDPNFSDTTEWEKDIKKEDINKNARRAMAEAIGEIANIHVFRETTPLRGDITLHPAFILCLSLFVTKIIEPIKKELQNLDCFIKFSKWLSWLFRHGKSLLHDSLSLTLSELFHFREFRKHTNNCLTFITRFDWETHIFGKFDTPEVREHCRNERVNFDSMRYFIPFVTVTCFNDGADFTSQLSTKALSESRTAMNGSLQQ